MRELKSWRRVKLSLVRERAPAPYAVPLRMAADVARLVSHVIADDPREQFVAVYVDARHRPIAVHTCAVGSSMACPVHPGAIFGPALQLSAVAVIVAHNHPSGDASPSPEDRAMTERLKSAGELLGVELLDHVVLGAERFWSEADQSFTALG